MLVLDEAEKVPDTQPGDIVCVEYIGGDYLVTLTVVMGIRASAGGSNSGRVR